VNWKTLALAALLALSPLPSFADSLVTLEWNAPTQNADGTPIDGLTGYRLCYSGLPIPDIDDGVADCSTLILYPATTYEMIQARLVQYYRVTAFDEYGNESIRSNEAVGYIDGSGEVIDTMAPGAPVLIVQSIVPLIEN